MTETNYYEVLELDKEATPEQIEEAFLRLADEYNPDKSSALPAKLRVVAEEEYGKYKEAYDNLTDEEGRARHDNDLMKGEGEAAMKNAHGVVENAQNMGIDIEGPNHTLELSYNSFQSMDFTRTIELTDQCIEEVMAQYLSVINSLKAGIEPRLSAAKEAGVGVSSAEDHLENIEMHLDEMDYQKALEATKMVDGYLEDLKPRYLMQTILKTLINVTDQVNGALTQLAEANEGGMDIDEALQLLKGVRDLIDENVE